MFLHNHYIIRLTSLTVTVTFDLSSILSACSKSFSRLGNDFFQGRFFRVYSELCLQINLFKKSSLKLKIHCLK